MSKPVVLCILDGWGLSPRTDGNAVALASTPHFDRVMAQCPSATLVTHGPDVGLPAGQMGNSEVGHMNIGAGRVVSMDLGRIDLAIEDGSFAQNQALVRWVEGIRTAGGAAHLLGVVSDGGVHGSLDHMIAAARAICAAGVPVWIHAFADGRDVAPKSVFGYLETLEDVLPDGARVATLTGRYYAMDRDNRWERVGQATAAILRGDGRTAGTAKDAVAAAYDEDKSDEFLPAFVIGDYAGARDGDGLFCLNFRADRARQILAALGAPDFAAFEVGTRPSWSGMLGMAPYSDAHDAYMTTAFPKERIDNTLGAWVARAGLRQYRLAETEKYPHVTFFLNGGREPPEPGEDRFMPPSPKVATYDLQPEMSAPQVTERLVAAIRSDYDLIVVNYANPDMVGHTGDLQAAIRACEAVDRGLGDALAALDQTGGAMVLCADHGNCEMMIDPHTGGPHTAHTLNPVPVAVIGATGTLSSGRLADLAPTILALMGLEPPPEMTGRSLLS